MRLRLQGRTSMRGAHLPGVPSHRALRARRIGHRRKHLAPLSASQPVRSRPGVRPPQLLEGARWRVEHIADAWATRPVMPEAGRTALDPDATTSPDPPEPRRAATQSTGPDLVAWE